MQKRSRNKNLKTLSILCLIAVFVLTCLNVLITADNKSSILIINVLIYIVSIFYFYVLFSTYEDEVNNTDKELKDAKNIIAASQARVHWLANTLESCAEIVTKNTPEENEDLMLEFARYLRVNEEAFAENVRQIIPLSEEIDNVKNYVNIEKINVPNVHVDYYIEDEDIKLPIYTIQPLVNNAIKHGIKNYKDSTGIITIHTFKQDNKHIIEVIDDGKGFDPKVKLSKKHIGIRNVKYRLETLMNASMKVESVLGFGTQIRIEIPIEK